MVVTKPDLTTTQVATIINPVFQLIRGVLNLFSAIVKTTAQTRPNNSPNPTWIASPGWKYSFLRPYSTNATKPLLERRNMRQVIEALLLTCFSCASLTREKVMRTFRFVLIFLVLAFTGVTHAAPTIYSLPADLNTGPFLAASCDTTTYICTGNLDFGNDNQVVLNIASNFTLRVNGNFVVKNNLCVYDLPGIVTFDIGGNFEAQNNTGKDCEFTANIKAGGNVILGNNTNITGNVDAGGNLIVGSGTINGNCTYATTNYTCTSRTISVVAVSLTEGDSSTKPATFTVTLSTASTTTAVTVNYATSNGTATGGACGTAGVDYATTSGTATIPIGATATTFIVSICGDTSIEVDETFTVTLSAPVNAALGSPSSATGTITNDDVCACVPKNGNLISNPDFEELCASTITQNFGAVNGGTVNMRNGVCGWTMNGRGMETWENTTTTPASKGTVFVEIDGYSDTVDCLKQNIATTAGIAYTLKVDYRARTTTLEGLIVKWNGIEKYSTNAAPTSAWQTITVSGLTAIGNDLIEFCEPSASNNSLGSWIDNVRVQTFFPDHYEVSVPSSNVACLASTVKVTSCADNASPCTALATPSMPTANLATSAGTLASGTLTFSAGGIATTTLSYPSAANDAAATLTLSGESVPGANARTCCIGSTCSTTDNCAVPFKTAGFIFATTATGASATLPTQTAGTASDTTYLRAVQTSTSTGACVAALNPGATTVNLAYECNNPTSCSSGNLISVNGGSATPIQRNNNGSGISYTSTSMTFDANGSAPFTYTYSDVGQVKLHAQKAALAPLLTALTGSSNAFVVKPAGFTVTEVKQTAAPQLLNPEATNATGAKFVKSGEAFTAKVTATTNSGAAAPNFGKEINPEGVLLTRVLILPSPGNPGTLDNATVAGGSFVNGIATVTNLAYDEVGIITLTPSVSDGDYLGVGAVSGTTSSNIGRFIPDHFAITPGSVAPACASGAFTYFGQDGVTTPFILTAQNLSNGTTQNYTGAFAKLALSTWGAAPASAGLPGFGFSAVALPAGSVLSASATTPSGSWGAGVTNGLTVKHQVSRPTALTGITSLTISATPVDSDGVTMAQTPVAAASNFYYGRLRFLNGYGSELLALPMDLTAQYWNGSGFVKNTWDSCTTLTVPTSGTGMVFGPGNLSGGETVASIQGATTGSVALLAGDARFSLSKPGSGNNGNVDITINTPAWLWYQWTGGAVGSASARATFGLYKSPLIYRRENY